METRQDMEQRGLHVRGTYKGPFDYEYACSVLMDLQQAKCEDGSPVFAPGSLHVVSQGNGYNVVYALDKEV